MTARERQASGGVVLAQRPPTPRPTPSGSAAPTPSGPFSWHDLFHHLTDAQHHEVLAAATPQGVVYSHQLPSVDPIPTKRSPLANLLAGRQPDLPAIAITPRPLHDSALDTWQQQAVWRALQSPEICLIHGQPGTGKSRVVAEILRQTADQGQRVLFVAPAAAALDQVLHQVGSHPSLFALRCLHNGEAADQLHPVVGTLTLAARLRHLREDVIANAETAVTAAEQQEQKFAGLLEQTERAAALIHRRADIVRQHEALEARRADLNAEVTRALPLPENPLTAALRAATGRAEQLHAELQQLRTTTEETVARLEQQRAPLLQQKADLTPLVQAKQDGQWWTGAWWRATVQGNPLQMHEALLGQLQQLDAEEQQARDKVKQLEILVQSSKDEVGALTADEQRRAQELAAEIAQARHQEEARLHAEITAQLTQLQVTQESVTAEWQQLHTDLTTAAGSDNPDQRRSQWQQQQQEARARLDFARRWKQSLHEALPTWQDRLPRLANVVAVPLSALAHDPLFGDKAAAALSFDLLIVEEAEHLTEADFQALARRCARWVLIGELPADPEPPRTANFNRGGGRPSIVRPGVFQRLWQQLHCDPRRLPVRWQRRNERLCCQLRRIQPEQERWVEREPVLDRADVELTIVSPPRAEPMLAEVSFPGQMPLDEAKRFIYGEVQELSVQSHSPACYWTEEGNCLRFQLAGTPDFHDVAIRLADGVIEWVRSHEANSFETLALDFCQEEGWTRSRAEEWLRLHGNLRDHGRSMVLDRVHRMHPDLAAIVHDLQGEDTPASAAPAALPAWAEWTAPLVFVPVPALRGDPRRAAPRQPDPRRGNGAGTPSRGRFEARGAGIEYDLADTAHPPNVPHELRQQLPAQGLVNWMEAEAVVRAVETLVGDPNYRAAAGTSPLAVAALYPAQAQLIHLLLLASEVLTRAQVVIVGPDAAPSQCADHALVVEVNVPAAWKQRECSGMLVSLTRSHSHRAVQLGDQPAWLPLALTRARQRIILFGDPGTLVRRAQWMGAVDSLDEGTGNRERELVSQLVQYLQGHGLHSDRFQLCEGSSA